MQCVLVSAITHLYRQSHSGDAHCVQTASPVPTAELQGVVYWGCCCRRTVAASSFHGSSRIRKLVAIPISVQLAFIRDKGALPCDAISNLSRSGRTRSDYPSKRRHINYRYLSQIWLRAFYPLRTLARDFRCVARRGCYATFHAQSCA